MCTYAAVIDADMEASIVIQALRVNTLSKLTFADSVRFEALVQDVCPGVKIKDVEHEQLTNAVREVGKETNIVINDIQASICVFNNFEMMIQNVVDIIDSVKLSLL